MLGKFAPAGNAGLLKKFKNQFTDGGGGPNFGNSQMGGSAYKMGF